MPENSRPVNMRAADLRPQNPARASHWAHWLWLSALVVLLDQASKFWAVRTIAQGDSLPVTPFFNWVLTYNPGAAFSFLADASGWQRPFFITFTLAAVGVITWMLRRHAEERRFSLGLALILGGALGNLWDRIWLGHVVDFLDFHVAGHHWPAFNVADAGITLGVGLLLLDSFSRRPTSTRH